MGSESNGFLPRLSWSHYRAIMRVKSPEARAFYETEASECGWDKRDLERQIHSQYYERILSSQDPQAMRLAESALFAEERLPVRWSTYDYSAAGAYFITVCVKDRQPVFGTVVGGKMVHSEAGKIANRCLFEIPHHFPAVTVDASVVMPDHVHAILAIETSDPTVVGIGHARSLQRQKNLQRTRPLETLPLAVGSYKSSVTRLVRAAGNKTFQWQKSYHDRIIRDPEEYERIHLYIAENPRRWSENILEALP